MHFNLNHARALAGFAAPAFDVKAKAPRLIAACLGFGQACKPLTDGRKSARIGGGVRARRAPNRTLVNVNDLIEMLKPFGLIMFHRYGGGGTVQLTRCGLVKRLNGECRFSAARYARHAGEQAERELCGDVLEVIAACACDGEFLMILRLAALIGDGDLLLARQILPRQRSFAFLDLGGCAVSNDFAAIHAS